MGEIGIDDVRILIIVISNHSKVLTFPKLCCQRLFGLGTAYIWGGLGTAGRNNWGTLVLGE